MVLKAVKAYMLYFFMVYIPPSKKGSFSRWGGCYNAVDLWVIVAYSLLDGFKCFHGTTLK